MTTDNLTLPREAIKELIADGIREYESKKGESRDRGHPDLGAVLRRYMDDNSLSLRLLSERSGVSSSMITKVIQGIRLPSYDLLARWRRALGDDFLLAWFDTVESLDTASRLVGDTIYLTIPNERGPGYYVIRRSTYERMVNRCIQANKRVFGKTDEAKCRREIDLVLRQEYQQFGELVKGDQDGISDDDAVSTEA